MTSEARTHTYCAWAACGDCKNKFCPLEFSLRGRRLKGKGEKEFYAREKREGGAWSRALIPFPFPFERLPRRLSRIVSRNNGILLWTEIKMVLSKILGMPLCIFKLSRLCRRRNRKRIGYFSLVDVIYLPLFLLWPLRIRMLCSLPIENSGI